MATIKSVADTFQEFSDWLCKERPSQVQLVGRLANGFEGWLKVEFLGWLVNQRGMTPGVDAGLEYKASLDQRASDVDRDETCCDLWVCGPTESDVHYVELKTPFCNPNAGKLFRSAGIDLLNVSRLHRVYERASTGSVIVFGVGFDDETWAKGRELLRDAAKLDAYFQFSSTGKLSPHIRWDVWTHTYREPWHIITRPTGKGRG